MKSQIYKQAKYYEIAFSFINAKKQVDLFGEFIEKYSKISVKNVLDVACGPALQLRELAKRGYGSFGIDCNSGMISYLKRMASEDGLEIEVIKADMNKFSLKKKIDFAYIMMGSIIYVRNNDLFLSHLNSVANSLKFGGLYLIENFPINWADPKFFKKQRWVMKRDGVKIKTAYQLTPKDALKQIVTQVIEMEVIDKGKEFKYIDRDDLKIIFPEEFKLLVDKNGRFEFLGFYERKRAKPLKKISSDNIVLLRKK